VQLLQRLEGQQQGNQQDERDREQTRA